MENLNKKCLIYSLRFYNKRRLSNNIYNNKNLSQELNKNLAFQSAENNLKITNSSNNKKIKIFHLNNHLNNIHFKNGQDSHNNKIKKFKTKRTRSCYINKISDFFNLRLLNRLSNPKNNNYKSIIFSANIYLPNILKNNFGFIPNIMNNNSKTPLKKSKSINQYNNINCCPLKLPNVTNKKVINDYNYNQSNNNNFMNKIYLKKKNLIRCNSSKNINVKNLYFPFRLVQKKLTISDILKNNNLLSCFYKNNFDINKDKKLITYKFHKLDNYVFNNFRDLSKKENTSNYSDKNKYIVKNNKNNINNNFVDNDMMLNDKGTLIKSFFKK